MKWVKATDVYGEDLWINLSQCRTMWREESTRIVYANGEILWVKDTPEELLASGKPPAKPPKSAAGSDGR